MNILGFRNSSRAEARPAPIPSPIGGSPIEKAFQAVPDFQNNLPPRSLRALCRVSSTMNAVANDPYVWRRFLARELGVLSGIMKYPIDRQARAEQDQSAIPYKEIFRGLRIHDGEMAPTVVEDKRDEEQRRCVRRALHFMELHFPARLNAIDERHQLYRQPSDEVVLHGTAMGISAGITTVSGAVATAQAKSALHYATLSKAAAVKSSIVLKLIGAIGLKATKALLFGFHGFVAINAAMAVYGFGQVSYNEYHLMRASWRAIEREVAASKITGHLASMRVQRQVNEYRQEVPTAGLNETRLARLANRPPEAMVFFGAQQ